MFIACHPVLAREARVALTLRMVGGLGSEEIARAFLVSEPTIAQRIVRAKRALAEAGVPFEVPRGAELEDRLASVLEVIYLIFNEGYSATAGDDIMRPALCDEALRLGLLVAQLVPSEGDAHGLVALMALHVSRSHARIDDAGQPVLLLEQDRARWDQEMIQRGLSALERAEASGPRGPYTIQAAISACHARARAPEDTEWPRIAMLYGKLSEIVQSPVVELNRAVAVAMAYGPAKGLEIVDALMTEPALAGYHLLPSARADLLAKLGRYDEARAEFERAAQLTHNDREREMLRASAAACVPPSA